MQAKTLLLLLPAVAMAQTSTDADLTATAADACSSAIEAFATKLPTPPAKLATNTEIIEPTGTGVDPCDVTVPPSLVPDVSAYASTVLSFFSANSKDVESLFSSCSGAADYGLVTSCANKWLSSINSGSQSATKTGSASDSTITGSTHAATTTGTAHSTGESTASSKATKTSTSEGGAAKETGIKLAAVAVAGLVAAAL